MAAEVRVELLKEVALHEGDPHRELSKPDRPEERCREGASRVGGRLAAEARAELPEEVARREVHHQELSQPDRPEEPQEGHPEEVSPNPWEGWRKDRRGGVEKEEGQLEEDRLAQALLLLAAQRKEGVPPAEAVPNFQTSGI